MADKIKETDLWIPLEKLMIASNMEIFKEVVVGASRADAVGRQRKIITVMEMKTSLNVQVIEQAYAWIGKAHYSYIVIPQMMSYNNRRRRIISPFIRRVLVREGIGVITVSLREIWGEIPARIEFPAKLYRNIRLNWDKYLMDFYKDSSTIPGSNREHMTPYKNMMNHVEQYVRIAKHPVKIQEIIQHVQEVTDHYLNPAGGLYQAITSFERDRFDTIKIGGKLHVIPKRRPVL